MHRDFAAHLALGMTPYELLCQYLANADSPTRAREGNVHHGDPASRRFPMISHLGKMLSLAVGGTWAARRNHEDVVGLAVIGDGGSSTGEFHESLNIASVFKLPVIFLVQNNHYAFSTPTSHQYRCTRLSDRARGYGIEGVTIDGTDVWQVYCSVWDAIDRMQRDPAPVLIESMTLRLHGHAAYDKATYVSKEQMDQWRREDPLPKTRAKLLEVCGFSEAEIGLLESEIEDRCQAELARALAVARPTPAVHLGGAYAPARTITVPPFQAKGVKNGDAVNHALDYLLRNNPRAFLLGLDVGVYGSAFKTCKGLWDRHGPDRVIDMPVAESAMVGFALGASQLGAEPILEFQFADFGTEAVSQLGLNAATWFFRSGHAAPAPVSSAVRRRGRLGDVSLRANLRGSGRVFRA